MKLKEYFIKNYLTAGMTRDDYIFANCNNDLIDAAKQNLSNRANSVKPCIIQIDKSDSEYLNFLFSQCNNTEQKQIVAGEYILQKVLLAELEGENCLKGEFDKLVISHKQLKSGNMNRLFSGYNFNDIETFMELVGKIELDFFLIDVKNKQLQQAINDYISSRTKYSVKIFSNVELCSYYDQAGNIIQSPHDYLNINIRHFVEQDNQIEL